MRLSLCVAAHDERSGGKQQMLDFLEHFPRFPSVVQRCPPDFVVSSTLTFLAGVLPSRSRAGSKVAQHACARNPEAPKPGRVLAAATIKGTWRPCEAVFIFLFLVSVYKVPFQYW